MEAQTEPQTRPTIGRLILYFLFAWFVSLVTGISTAVTAVCFFDLNPDEGFSFGAAVIGLALAALRYGAGAFVLGTLTQQRIKTWTAAVIYIIPAFLFQGLIFAAAAASDATKEELLTKPAFLIVMPIVYLLVSPFVSFYFVRLGKDSAGTFSRPNSALDLHWLHWLWVLPFGLFQVIGVPLFLLLLLWKIDLLMDDLSFASFIFSLPSLISRILVFVILAGVVMAIGAAHDALSRESRSAWIRVFTVLGTWLLLTAIQIFIFLSCIGKHLD